MEYNETYEVDCPSGLRGLVRPLLVGDINNLASRSSQKKGDPLSIMFKDVWIKTLDTGPYKTLEKNEPIKDFREILVGDRAFLVFEIRRLTYGNDFFFSVQCRSCKEKIEWQLDLTELEVTGLSDEMKAEVEGKDVKSAFITRTLPKAETKVGIKLLDGYDQNKIEQAQKGLGIGAMGMFGLLSRLSFIDGAESPQARRDFIERMSVLDLEFLREEWEEADIHVQDTLEVECGNCGAETTLTIPTDEHFFSLRSARPRRKKTLQK